MKFRLDTDGDSESFLTWRLMLNSDGVYLQTQGDKGFWFSVVGIRHSDGKLRLLQNIDADLGLPLNRDGSIQIYNQGE